MIGENIPELMKIMEEIVETLPEVEVSKKFFLIKAPKAKTHKLSITLFCRFCIERFDLLMYSIVLYMFVISPPPYSHRAFSRMRQIKGTFAIASTASASAASYSAA